MRASEFIDIVTAKVSENYKVTKAQTSAYIAAIKETVFEAMAAGDDLSITGLAKFTVQDVPQRTVRNPKTGEKMEVPAKKRVKIKPLGELKKSVL